MNLCDYVDIFLQSRDVSHLYSAMLRAHVRHFVAWCGGAVCIEHVDCEKVNAWLTSLKGSRLSPHTQDTYRRNLLCVWRAAFVDGLNDNAPLRVKTIKKPRLLVRAYTHDEIRRLLSSAAALKGRHTNGNMRRDFWRALIHAAYSTGLRRSDLLLIFRHDVADDGTLQLVQQKTGYTVCVQLSTEALHFAARLEDANGLLLPWPYRKDALSPRFQSLRKAAGIQRGSLKWIRRSAASYAERENPGAGSRLLGHRGEQTFRQHYDDASISRQHPFRPPPLGG